MHLPGREGRTCAQQNAWRGHRVAQGGPEGWSGSGHRVDRPAPYRRTGLGPVRHRPRVGTCPSAVIQAARAWRGPRPCPLQPVACSTAEAQPASSSCDVPPARRGPILTIVFPIIPPPPVRLDLREAGGQAEVVVLGPDVERVVVTLSTAESKRPGNAGRSARPRSSASGPSSSIVGRAPLQNPRASRSTVSSVRAKSSSQGVFAARRSSIQV